MIDLSRIADTFSGLFGASVASAATELLSGSDFAGMLAERGLDPSILEGLGQAEIVDLLAQQGIDLASLAPGELGNLLQSLGVGEDMP